MPKLTILPSGRTIDAAPGAGLRDVLVGAGAGLLHRCGGNLKCGTCHVFLHEGRKTVGRIEPGENALLDSIPGVGSKSRLACQVKLGTEDLTVEILGFASGG